MALKVTGFVTVLVLALTVGTALAESLIGKPAVPFAIDMFGAKTLEDMELYATVVMQGDSTALAKLVAAKRIKLFKKGDEVYIVSLPAEGGGLLVKFRKRGDTDEWFAPLLLGDKKNADTSVFDFKGWGPK